MRMLSVPGIGIEKGKFVGWSLRYDVGCDEQVNRVLVSIPGTRLATSMVSSLLLGSQFCMRLVRFNLPLGLGSALGRDAILPAQRLRTIQNKASGLCRRSGASIRVA